MEGAKRKNEMRVLIAEDDLVSRKILESVLVKWGYEVISTRDGNEAWERLKTLDSPQLAILDWMMPGKDGVALCQELRQQERLRPLYMILLTAKDRPEDILRGLNAGADDYIVKPFNSEELRARVNVGRRMLGYQTKLMEKEKLTGVLEMAGAVCHELNQPLQTVLGFSDLLLTEITEGDPKYPMLKTIKGEIERIGKLTQKIMRITKYRAKDYIEGQSRIIDIESSSSP